MESNPPRPKKAKYDLRIKFAKESTPAQTSVDLSRDRQRRYREKVRNGQHAESYRRKESTRQRDMRQTFKAKCEDGDEDALQKLLRQRVQARERAKKYRRQKKSKAVSVSTTTKRPTKRQRQEKKEYWRLRKQESRRRLQIHVKLYTPDSKSNLRVYASRARNALPKSPGKFAKVIQHILKNASPRKKRAMGECRMETSSDKTHRGTTRRNILSGITSKLDDLKVRRTKANNKLRATIVNAACKNSLSLHANARKLGLRWSYLQKINKKGDGVTHCRTDTISVKRIRTVNDFYRRADVSVVLPDVKRVNKHGACRALRSSVRKVFLQYKKECSKQEHDPVGLTTFQSNRPKDVKLESQQKMRNCLCEICANIAQLGEAVKKATKFTCKRCSTLREMVSDERTMVNSTLCSTTTTFHRMECIRRECKSCGIHLITDEIQHLAMHKVETVDWHRWENVKSGDKRKMCLCSVTGPLNQLTNILQEDLQDFALHKFNASWQYKQFQSLTSSIPPRTVVMVMDFGQNYVCSHQDEPQQLHWDGHSQVTIHPLVCFYQCPRCPTKVTRHELVVLTDDLKHDCFAVNHFEKLAVQKLQKDSVDISSILEFSDGCAAQYKSCNTFEDISNGMEYLGVNVNRSFFGSRHGKGPSDGVTAVVKSSVGRAVKNRNAIVRNSEEMYKYCAENLTRGAGEEEACNHSRCDFMLVRTEEIDRTRPHSAKTIKGTRGIHQIKMVSPGKVGVRKLSCYCDACSSSVENTKCENEKYVDVYQIVDLSTGKPELSKPPIRSSKARGSDSAAVIPTRGPRWP